MFFRRSVCCKYSFLLCCEYGSVSSVSFKECWILRGEKPSHFSCCTNRNSLELYLLPSAEGIILNSVLVFCPAALHTAAEAGLLPGTAPPAPTAAFHTLGRGSPAGTARAGGATPCTETHTSCCSARLTERAAFTCILLRL